MVFPFCLASTLRAAKLLPSRKRLTSYMMGTAKITNYDHLQKVTDA